MDGSMPICVASYVQCDEIWTYVGKKQRRGREGDAEKIGDQWVFVAMDAETKLVPVYTVGNLDRLMGACASSHHFVTNSAK